MSYKINGDESLSNDGYGTFNITNVGQYTTETLPSTGIVGDIIFNTSTSDFLMWEPENGEWITVFSATGSATTRTRSTSTFNVSQSGGTAQPTIPGDGYRYYYFTSPGSFNVSDVPDYGETYEFLLVAGGGGGGNAPGGGGGGGGAGGLIQQPLVFYNGIYNITIGNGGSGGTTANPGEDSKIVFSDGTTITAFGGGAGGYNKRNYNAGTSGGSGGGARTGNNSNPGYNPPGNQRGGTGLIGQGKNGGASSSPSTQPNSQSGGGGGGYAQTGKNAPSPTVGGNGGNGLNLQWDIPTDFGTPGPASGRYFAGGGAGNTAPRGGYGGGGSGTDPALINGVANTGGGGGSIGPNNGGTGGSGIAIIRVPYSGDAPDSNVTLSNAPSGLGGPGPVSLSTFYFTGPAEITDTTEITNTSSSSVNVAVRVAGNGGPKGYYVEGTIPLSVGETISLYRTPQIGAVFAGSYSSSQPFTSYAPVCLMIGAETGVGGRASPGSGGYPAGSGGSGLNGSGGGGGGTTNGYLSGNGGGGGRQNGDAGGSPGGGGGLFRSGSPGPGTDGSGGRGGIGYYGGGGGGGGHDYGSDQGGSFGGGGGGGSAYFGGLPASSPVGSKPVTNTSHGPNAPSIIAEIVGLSD